MGIALIALIPGGPLLVLHAANARFVLRIPPWKPGTFYGLSGKPFRAFSSRSKVLAPTATNKGSGLYSDTQALGGNSFGGSS
jgi:hypothetical protein